VSGPDGAALADAWRPWVTGGPVRGPDGAMVTIWVRYVGQDLPFGDRPADRAPLTWQELAAVRKVHTACVRRMPAGPAREFCSFVTEISARWYAFELALRCGKPAPPERGQLPHSERPRSARSGRVLAEEILVVRSRSGHGSLWLPQHASHAGASYERAGDEHTGQLVLHASTAGKPVPSDRP
jgi:hypothetical protein